jgi:hypothetical protein
MLFFCGLVLAAKNQRILLMNLRAQAVFVALVAMLLCPHLAAQAQGRFGNSPTGGGVFGFVANGGDGSGGAVTFTPLQDFRFSSITIWVANYTGRDMYGNLNQSFYAGVYSDGSTILPGYTNNQPGALVADLGVPNPNNGSLADFTFINLSPGAILQANTKYWLFIYEKTSGSFNWGDYPLWIGGGSPVGDAVYNGSYSFAHHSFSSSLATPAFTINAVPEPGTNAIFALGLLACGVCMLYRRRCSIPDSSRNTVSRTRKW